MNYEYLGNQLGIVTDGIDSSEVSSILEWLKEKKVLTIDGIKIKEEFEKKFAQQKENE